MPSFAVKKMRDDNGQVLDSVVKTHDDGKEEVWCSIIDLDRLFDTCVARWGNNWDLEKVLTAIRGARFN